MEPEELAACQARYDAAVGEAAKDGTKSLLEAFEQAVASQSCAIISRGIEEVSRLASSPLQLYASFYELVGAHARLPDYGAAWDRLRALADTVLFGDENKAAIKHAALSLTQTGVPYYGECHMVLAEDMIAHRASVFEENSVLHYKKHVRKDGTMRAGFRAAWHSRGKFAVAKLGKKIHKKTQEADFPGILLAPGKKLGEEKFIEVHIYGSLSVQSLQAVTMGLPASAVEKARHEKLAKMLSKYQIPLIELPI